MKKSMYAVLSIFLMFSSAESQGVADEMVALRKHLELPENINLALASSSRISQAGPLKVYLAFGLDIGVRNNFEQWINKWNKGDGKKFGALQVISQMAQADVILARYVVPSDATSTTSGAIYANSGIMVGRTGLYQTIPVYAYVVARTPTAVEVRWRYTGQTTTEETVKSGEKLWEDFRKMLKARGKLKK